MTLPGYYGLLVRFERDVVKLTSMWGTVFSLVPLHIFVCLCAKHVANSFVKGIRGTVTLLTAFCPRNWWVSLAPYPALIWSWGILRGEANRVQALALEILQGSVGLSFRGRIRKELPRYLFLHFPCDSFPHI